MERMQVSETGFSIKLDRARSIRVAEFCVRDTVTDLVYRNLTEFRANGLARYLNWFYGMRGGKPNFT